MTFTKLVTHTPVNIRSAYPMKVNILANPSVTRVFRYVSHMINM